MDRRPRAREGRGGGVMAQRLVGLLATLLVVLLLLWGIVAVALQLSALLA